MSEEISFFFSFLSSSPSSFLRYSFCVRAYDKFIRYETIYLGAGIFQEKDANALEHANERVNRVNRGQSEK